MMVATGDLLDMAVEFLAVDGVPGEALIGQWDRLGLSGSKFEPFVTEVDPVPKGALRDVEAVGGAARQRVGGCRGGGEAVRR